MSDVLKILEYASFSVEIIVKDLKHEKKDIK